MTQDEIIRMAREAGFSFETGQDLHDNIPALERFAALVAAHEREKQTKQEPTTIFSEWFSKVGSGLIDDLPAKHFAWKVWEAAVLAEREACAKVCENLPTPKDATTLTHIPTLETCAAAIRARGK